MINGVWGLLKLALIFFFNTNKSGFSKLITRSINNGVQCDYVRLNGGKCTLKKKIKRNQE